MKCLGNPLLCFGKRYFLYKTPYCNTWCNKTVKDEMITREEYNIFKEEFDKAIQEAKDAIARLVGNRNQVRSGLTQQQSWLAQFREYKNIQELNRRVVVHFVERIEISTDKSVHVRLNHEDQFQAILEFLDEEQKKKIGEVS